MANKNMQAFEDLLARIDKKLDFMAMNPLNEAAEQKKFFAKPGYNPVFKYPAPSSGTGKLFRKAEEIRLVEGVVSLWLLEKLDKFRKIDELMHSIDTEKFTMLSQEIFGAPDDTLIRNAYQILKKEPVHEENSLSSEQVCSALRNVLDEFRLKDWKVEVKKMAANAAVLNSRRLVCVQKDAKFPESFLKRVVAHEIGTHVFRGANGEKQPYRIFKTGLPDYLMTEEGLAVNVEEMNDCLKINTLRAYAGRVIAVKLSLESGFRKIYDELRKSFDERLAWKLTLRAKRGLRNTSLPGAYTKDHLYLKGYYEIKKFLAEHRSAGLKALYYGRISFEQALLINSMDELKEPDLLPDSEKFKKIMYDLTV
jgi:uncharacterized protein (TIGR02421 family)